jgi:hypothetical protein
MKRGQLLQKVVEAAAVEMLDMKRDEEIEIQLG